MTNYVAWPLTYNIIRRRIVNNTFGNVRKKADGTPKPHQGWDFEAAPGTAVYAIASGKVAFVKVNEGDYGTQICHSFEFGGKTRYVFYAHLSSTTVKKGDTVKQGQVIGATGKSGNAVNLGPLDDHLHFEIRTQAVCGLGLAGRISPAKIYGTCPLKEAAYQNFSYMGAEQSADQCSY